MTPLISTKVRWPRSVCPRCTRIGRRNNFNCEMTQCPPVLIKVRSAAEYAALARAGTVLELEQPKKPKTKPKPRRPRALDSVHLSRPEISRMGALARWVKWRKEKSQQEKKTWQAGK